MKPFFAVHTYINVTAVQIENCLFHLWIMAKKRISSFVYSLVLIALLSLTPASGTSIIAFLMNGKVAVAADSKERIETGDWHTYSSVCKLHTAHRFVWAVFGVVAQLGVWDVKQSIDQIAKTNKASVAKIAELDAMVPRYIRNIVETMQKTSPRQVLFLTKEQPEIFSALYIGLDNGKVIASTRHYVLNLVKGKISIESKWGLDCPKGCYATQMFVIGTERAVQRYIRKNPKARWPQTVDGAVEMAVEMVKLEIEDEPDNVGLPINTAIIDTTGVRWGINNSTCPNTDETIKPKPAKPSDKPKK